MKRFSNNTSICDQCKQVHETRFVLTDVDKWFNRYKHICSFKCLDKYCELQRHVPPPAWDVSVDETTRTPVVQITVDNEVHQMPKTITTILSGNVTEQDKIVYGPYIETKTRDIQQRLKQS